MESKIGENIRYYRKLAGLTQSDLAQEAGISLMSVRRYESGERFPTKKTLQEIADALEISPEFLLRDMQTPSWEETIKLASYICSDTSSESVDKMIDGIVDILFPPGSNEAKMQEVFEKLNETGQKKAIDYASDLVGNFKYRK